MLVAISTNVKERTYKGGKVRITKGDLITMAKHGEFDVVIHGCNCFHIMGAGVAWGLRNAFPEVFQADLETQRGAFDKLGTCSEAVCEIDGGVVTVVNAYTQYSPGGPPGTVNVDYQALRKCMVWVKTNHSGKKIGIPKIGAGLAGGDWDKISKIICEELGDEDVTLVLYQRASH